MAKKLTETVETFLYATPVGRNLKLTAAGGGLAECDWTDLPPDSSLPSSPILIKAIALLDRYFSGDMEALSEMSELAPANATPFRCEVWRALRSVPPGVKRTYSALCLIMGLTAGSARAVAAACAANPIQLFVPCHRIVAASGPGGYRGGVEVKCALLNHEKNNH